MTDDLATFDNPLHPRFVDDTDGKKAERFNAHFKWLHAEAVTRNNGNLPRAAEWVLTWRSEPDDVEAALMLAVSHLIEQSMEFRHRRMAEVVQQRHERRSRVIRQADYANMSMEQMDQLREYAA